MIGVKTGLQINRRLHRKVKGKFFKVIFLNRRGLKILTSTSPINEKYIKLPYVDGYSENDENEIISFIEENDKR